MWAQTASSMEVSGPIRSLSSLTASPQSPHTRRPQKVSFMRATYPGVHSSMSPQHSHLAMYSCSSSASSTAGTANVNLDRLSTMSAMSSDSGWESVCRSRWWWCSWKLCDLTNPSALTMFPTGVINSAWAEFIAAFVFRLVTSLDTPIGDASKSTSRVKKGRCLCEIATKAFKKPPIEATIKNQ